MAKTKSTNNDLQNITQKTKDRVTRKPGVFLERFGKLNMTTTIKKQLQRQVETVMQYKKFLLDYLYEDWWLASIMPQEIAEEVSVSID
jgi:hypothetical protein